MPPRLPGSTGPLPVTGGALVRSEAGEAGEAGEVGVGVAGIDSHWHGDLQLLGRALLREVTVVPDVGAEPYDVPRMAGVQ